MTPTNQHAAAPARIAQKLEAIRRRKIWIQAWCALAAAAAVLLAAMGAAMLIDWLVTLYDSPWRVVLTLTALAAAVATAIGWGWLAWRRSLGWRQIAGDVDRRLPELEERWSTVTQLEQSGSSARQVVHPAMYRRVAAEAGRWEPKVEPQRIATLSPLVRNLIALSVVAAVLVGAALFDMRRTKVLIARFWQPASSISATSLANLPGDVVVGRGEAITLTASLEGAPVDRAVLLMQTAEGPEQTIPLLAGGEDDLELTHALRSVEQPFRYRFRAGDGQSPWFEVHVADRPEIRQVRLVVTPPAYTGQKAATFDRWPRRLSAMQNSELELAILPKQPLKNAELSLGGDRVAPLVADSEGWYRWRTTLDKHLRITPRLTESHGLANRRIAECEINVYSDKAPVVRVLTPEDEIAVRPKDTVEISISAQDDVGVESAELLIYDGSKGASEAPIATIPIPLDKQAGARSIEKTVELDLSQFKVSDGAELSYEVRVRESRGPVTAADSQAQPTPPASADAAEGQTAQNQSRPAATPEKSETPSEPQAAANENRVATTPPSTTAPAPMDSETGDSSATNRPGPTGRLLDVPQYSTSARQRLKIDEWAGSFDGQQRAKLEMAIAPELAALDEALAAAQQHARAVLDDIEKTGASRAAHEAVITAAMQKTRDGQKVIADLQRRSQDTPYAFIGLQVADIGVAHVEPARKNLWSALQVEGDNRTASVREGWQHLTKARELLKDLQGQFERTRREFQLAEAVDRVKRMYQVYVENTQALLQTQEDDLVRYQRKMAEFELDEEYLKRLREVLEMRRDLQAELARILADDPRLLRRLMDRLQSRSNKLREQLAGLASDQEELNREVRAWTMVSDADRGPVAQLLLMRHVEDGLPVTARAGELADRYRTWLPLDRESEDADLAAASDKIKLAAAAASELSLAAQRFVDESQRPRKASAEPAEGAHAADDDAAPAPEWDSATAMKEVMAKAKQFYEAMTDAEVAIRQLAVRDDEPEIAAFALNRLVEARRVISDASAWIRQSQAHVAGKYPQAAEVSQYRLASTTEELADKLSTLEQSMAALLENPDGKLPEPIAKKAQEFLATLDERVAPSQMAAVFGLRSSQLDRAVERQTAAGTALVDAERLYDEMVKLAIKEMDKLPVQDPIANLLDDPTLDELLAQLEQELPFAELLGVPPRPTNLQIMGDWLNAAARGAMGAAMLRQQMQFQDARARRRLDEAYRKAIARALKESSARQAIDAGPAMRLSNWNRLASKLSDDLQQGRDQAPPEEFRRAIEQYFQEISRERSNGADRSSGQ